MLCHLARGDGPFAFRGSVFSLAEMAFPTSMAPGLLFQGDVSDMGPAQSRAWVLTGPGEDLGRCFLLFTVHSRHLRFSALVLGPVLPQCLLGAWGPWAEAGTFPSKRFPGIYLRGVSASQQTCCKILQRPLFTEISTLTAYFWLSYSCTFPFSSKTAETGPFKSTLRLQYTLLIVCFSPFFSTQLCR